MDLPFDLKRVALGVLLGGTLGFAYQKLVGCRTGACPLTATPLRAITYGVVMGLLFTLTAAPRREEAAGAASGSTAPSAASDPHHGAPVPESPMTTAPTSSVLHLTTAAFDRVKAQEKPVIIDFWAPWCGPCRIQGPILDKVAQQLGDRAIVAKVNVDEEPALADPFGVQAIPTLVILKGGKVVQRFTGVQQADTLVRAVEAIP